MNRFGIIEKVLEMYINRLRDEFPNNDWRKYVLMNILKESEIYGYFPAKVRQDEFFSNHGIDVSTLCLEMLVSNENGC